MGLNRVVLGTRACNAPELVGDLAAEFGSRIVVGVDSRDGFVAVKGWTQRTAWTAVEFAQAVDRLGVQHLVFTDVATDGMLRGPNLEAVRLMCDGLAGSCNVIASGGVSCAADVTALRTLAGQVSHGNLVGVIVGKALYDGRVRLGDLGEN